MTVKRPKTGNEKQCQVHTQAGITLRNLLKSQTASIAVSPSAPFPPREFNTRLQLASESRPQDQTTAPSQTKRTFIGHVVSQKAYLPSRFPWQFGIHTSFQNAVLGWFSESKEHKIPLYSKVQMDSVSTYFKKPALWEKQKVETEIVYPVKDNLGQSTHQKRLRTITSVKPHGQDTVCILAGY